MEWRMILFIVLLVPLCSETCSIPKFTHTTSFSTSEWFSSRSRPASPNEIEVKWRRHTPKLANNTNLDMYRDWLHRHQNKEINVLEAEDYPGHLTCSVDENLKTGDTIFEFPMEKCMTAEHDAKELDGAPWELQLVSALLKARSQGLASSFVEFVRSLPRHVHLPMFFTDMELQNIEDEYLLKEVEDMRRFALLSFHALRGAEIYHAKLSRFVWALSVVYSLACEIPGKEVSYVLLPVPGLPGTKSNVDLTLENGKLAVVAKENLRKSETLSYYRGGSNADVFLFQGLPTKTADNSQAKIFSNINEIADWFFSSHGGVNTNRYLTVKVSRDATEAFKRVATKEKLAVKPGSFSVDSKGNVDLSLVCVLTSLFYARESIELHNRNAGGEGALDFDNEEGTAWQKTMELIARESERRVTSGSAADDHLAEEIRKAFSSGEKAVRERALAILENYSTDVLEDELLLKAASWEGLDTSPEESCATCRWQVDRQGWNDVLATELRASNKATLQSFLQRPVSHPFPSARTEATRSEETTLKKLSTWCEAHELSISDKISMTLINDSSSYQQKLVRGVLVQKDIDEGETLCTLALDAGLYDGSAESNLIQDSWDLAAVRLLEEKQLGVRSKWADYISILPREFSSPLYLESTDLAEVQWLPVLRELVQVRSSIRKSFLRLKSSRPTLQSYDEYKWAVTMVHSRAFTLPVLPDDKYSHYVLMPFMDMINHHYVYQADWMSQPVIDRKLEIVAKRPLKKGEQLFASFGPRSNDNLFLYYGFVLEDNPFDSAQIFPSFKDAVSWFLRTWSTNCSKTGELWARCESNLLQTTWTSVKRAIDDFENGSTGQSSDWWELVSRWSDFGYQYLPYQPGPTVYASGITDPSLEAAFTQASHVLHPPADSVSQSSLSSSDSDSGSNKTAHLLQQYFSCVRKLQSPLGEGLVTGHPCREDLVAALESTEHGKRRNELVARVSVALRCLEILSALPTTLDEDRKLLEQGTVNAHLQLAREFRYRKKSQLESVVHRLVSRFECS